MRTCLVFLLTFLFACADAPVKRRPSSEILMRFGEISHEKSMVKIFPPTLENGTLKYYFYLQLKDNEGKYIDCDPSEITLRNRKGKKISFTLERLFTGRYYLILDKTEGLSSSELTFFTRNKALPGQFKLAFNRPVRSLSKITLVKKEDYQLTLRLSLKDKDNRPVESPFVPEIMLDGLGEIGELKRIQEGIWEFKLSYPEENQILYLSVRAQGTYFPKIYRFQHVEK